ncbi:hypothetical protein AG1IA_06204 [Rhizoctonia solani AG-1 IA]|uniref:Uncharacterized protein n=1 Tax=Thanatephorus cucumeris (strain AG1-IA) TaxID=983506 RepID=L8WSK8_THACA|nr:hypothetical protein AG1IA_06204 [Rhizoctonia solani AG-1 IA]
MFPGHFGEPIKLSKLIVPKGYKHNGKHKANKTMKESTKRSILCPRSTERRARVDPKT